MTCKEILEDQKIRDIISSAENYRGQAQPESRLNIFTLISDYYYRENYHSDIIKEFLNPEGSHDEGYKYLNLFIQMLNQMLKRRGIEIDESCYTKSEVNREIHKIDILIKGGRPDSDGKYHFIIIENKINDAVDMYRQIPRYVDKIEKERGGIVDAVVYIPKNPYKSPNKSAWTDKEIRRIDRILCIIPAHHAEKINLADNWLIPCINASEHLDCISVLRQYVSLIKSLTPQIMSDNNTREFIKYITDNADDILKVEDIVTLRQMIDDIPVQMAKDLLDKFTYLNSDNESDEKMYFSEILQWEPNSCVLEIQERIHSSLQIFIYTNLSRVEAYTLSIRDWKNEGQNFEWLGKRLNEFKIDESIKGESVCSRTFAFNQKVDDIVQCVKDILQSLSKHL